MNKRLPFLLTCLLIASISHFTLFASNGANKDLHASYDRLFSIARGEKPEQPLFEILDKLKDQGFNLNHICDKHGRTLLGAAFCSDNLQLFDELISRYDFDVNVKNEFGLSIFLLVVLRHKDYRIVSLLEHGADPNSPVPKSSRIYSRYAGDTPLHIAVKAKDKYTVAKLIEKNANKQAIDAESHTPLQLAQKLDKDGSHKDVITLLKGNDAELQEKCATHFSSSRDPFCSPAFLNNSSSSSSSSIQQSTVSKNSLPKSFLTLVPSCSSSTSSSSTVSTIPSSISPSSTAMVNEIGFMQVVQEGKAVLVAKLLGQKRGFVEYADNMGNTALHYAARNGFSNIAKLLIEAGADVSKQNKKAGDTPLHSAIRGRHIEVILLLLNAKCDVMQKTYHGKTPIQLAVDYGFSDIALFIANHPRVQKFSVTKEMVDRLIVAVDKGDVNEMEKLLLEHPALVARAYKEDNFPLKIAVLKGNVRAAQLLINYGTDVLRQAHDGRSVLNYLMSLAESRESNVAEEVLTFLNEAGLRRLLSKYLPAAEAQKSVLGYLDK